MDDPPVEQETFAPPLPHSLPRYASPTKSRRGEAHRERRAHGEVLRQAAQVQRHEANRKVREMMRHKGRTAHYARCRREQLHHAIDTAAAAYTDRAREYRDELRQLPEGIHRAKCELSGQRQRAACALRSDKEVEWKKRRRESETARAEVARQLRDQVRHGTRRAVIPPEMDAQMRRFGIGPYAPSQQIVSSASIESLVDAVEPPPGNCTRVGPSHDDDGAWAYGPAAADEYTA